MRAAIVVAGVLASLGLLTQGALGQSASLSVCDYAPPESRLSDLRLQGSFQWYDGPYIDDRERSVSATVNADYGHLFSSPTEGRRLDAFAKLQGAGSEWTFDATGSGDLKTYFDGDLFAIGAASVDADSSDGLEFDVTGGVGVGRFRDVTPLAKAIRIQNDLLDLGALLAPLPSETLLSIAQAIGEIGPTIDEKTVAVAEQLIATDLIRDNDLGVEGLLQLESVMTSTGEGQLCGRDVQARLGVSLRPLPEMSWSATGNLLFNFAVAPDPVSQVQANGAAKFRLLAPNEWSIQGSVSYVRGLPDGWTVRSSYRLTVDHGWSETDRTEITHVGSASLTTRVLGSVGLSLIGELRHETGDEEITLSLAVHLDYDLL